MKKALNNLLFASAIAVALASCSGEPAAQGEKSTNAQPETEVLSQAKRIFYSLPSPLELSTLLKTAGGSFNESLLNDHKLAAGYQGSMKQALNLGVYGADLSYTTVFQQNQRSLLFLAASKKLAENLGVTEAFSKEMLERANNNINERDSMMAILTDAYWLSNSQLKEESRDNLATLTMMGGWVEGLYIGTHIVDPEMPDPEIAKRLMEQKYTSNQLQNLLESRQGEPMMEEAAEMMGPLFDFFNSLKVEKEANQVVEDASGVASISGKRTIVHTPEDLQKLRELVTALRAQIIS